MAGTSPAMTERAESGGAATSPQLAKDRLQERAAHLLGFGTSREASGDLQKRLGRAMAGVDFGDHLAIVGRFAERPGVERDGGDRLTLDRLDERADLDFRALGHADLVEAVQRRPV